MTKPPTFPRRYLPTSFDRADLAAIEKIYAELADRELVDLEALERWCLDWSELESAIDEEGARRYIDHTCHTDDPAVTERFMEWVEKFVPVLKPLDFQLKRKLADHPQTEALAPDRYATWMRSVRNSVELFREENIPLETEQAKLESEYDRIIGAITVEFEGEERTLPHMARYGEETDREVRERAFRVTGERVLREVDPIEDVFDRLLELRQQMAENAGFPTYRELRFRQLERFDYTPEDCIVFHGAVEKVVVPLQRRILERRQARLGIERLRPWDLAVDPAGRPPLRPFADAPTLVGGCREMFERVHPALGDHFQILVDQELLDLESRKGKAPGGYQCTLMERRLPFIFMNAAGLQGDVGTLLHEGGHAFHTLECREQPIRAMRDAPIEFAEVASMSMELIAAPHLDCFYADVVEARRARLEHLEGVVAVFSWVATIDEFQHWLYTHPGHDREQRAEAWLRISDRYRPDVVDHTGLESFRRWRWVRQSHLFGVPFYYIEYAIAQLGALQVWLNYRKAPDQAVTAYRSALALGGTRPLRELFEAANIRFDFSEATLGELLGEVAREVEQLWQEEDGKTS